MLCNLSEKLFREITDYCVSMYPYEAIAGLLGHMVDRVIYVTAFVRIHNVSPHPENTFQANPSQWIHLLYEAENDGKAVIGLLHSHPLTSALPSREDKETLWHTLPTYWIISLAEPTPILRIYETVKNKKTSSIQFEEITYQLIH